MLELMSYNFSASNRQYQPKNQKILHKVFTDHMR